MSVRDAFAVKFGEDQAAKIEQAADGHKNGVHDKQGSDPFKWALLICIGHECFTRTEYREWHGITAPVDELKDWIKEHADLASHDGDCDFLALFCGAYNEYVKRDPVEAQA